MERIIVKPSDFSIDLPVEEDLYKIFGKNYKEIIRLMYEKISAILNKNDLFTECVEKSLYSYEEIDNGLNQIELYLMMEIYDFDDNEREKIGNAKSVDDIEDREVLEKIARILDDMNEKSYFPAIGYATEKAFFAIRQNIFEKYITDRAPEFSYCKGVYSIQQCDWLIKKYQEYIELAKVDKTPNPPELDEEGCVVIRKGDLFHESTYSEALVDGVASRGLETGQLHGVSEDGETYFCVDFFKAIKDSTVNEICKYGNHRTNMTDKMVFVVSRSNIEGPDAMFPEITDYDAYNESTEKGLIARDFVEADALPLSYSNAAAILLGVPACMISSIIVNSDIEKYPEKVDYIASKFPKAHIVSRHTGKVIVQPKEKNLNI